MAEAIGCIMASNTWRTGIECASTELESGQRDKTFWRCREEALDRVECAWAGEDRLRGRIEPTAGDNVLHGWPVKMIWITLNTTELRGCRFRHVAQLTRWNQ